MALTKGTGPFGEQSNGTFNFDTSVLKAHTLYFEDCPKRVRAVFNGETVADSRRVKLLHETGHLPVYYFPWEDVRQDLLEPSDHTTQCPFKGNASYWSVRVGDRVAENAVWSYPEPIDSAPPLADYLAFYWRMMDHWYEEDEEVFVHLRDPYHRIDLLASSRHVRIKVNGEVVAETNRPKLLFEKPAHLRALRYGGQPSPESGAKVGADDQDRTGDLVLTKDALCQLSYIGLRLPRCALRRISSGYGRQVGRSQTPTCVRLTGLPAVAHALVWRT